MAIPKRARLGVELIKKVEKCELVAYPDPATGGDPWTIGWGSTFDKNNRPIRPGLKITQGEADGLLEHSLVTVFLPALQRIPYIGEMSDAQYGALLSFMYNSGPNFYGAKGYTTITRQLKNKEWDKIAATFTKYSMPDDPDVHEGLLARRYKEGALWNQGFKNTMSNKQISANTTTYLKKTTADAESLPDNKKVLVNSGRTYRVVSITPAKNDHSKIVLDSKAGTWYIYNPHWEGEETIGGIEENSDSITLKVRYFPQVDSNTRHALRMCFSSSCAMLADWIKPGCLGNDINADDTYLTKYVLRHGDTTIASSQTSALNDLGISAIYRQNLTSRDVIEQIKKGIPVPVGYLHHGPISDPRGGGHWAIIIGFDMVAKQWIVHDPFGEANLVGGGFVSGKNGRNCRYSFKNFNRRWEVNSSGRYTPGAGWGIIATK